MELISQEVKEQQANDVGKDNKANEMVKIIDKLMNPEVMDKQTNEGKKKFNKGDREVSGVQMGGIDEAPSKKKLVVNILRLST